jgi:ribosome-binding protein aMBF1 (putative translation factor)
MRLEDMASLDQVIAQRGAKDPAFAQQWERLALAREIAHAVIAYRQANNMSQRKLADHMGVSQPLLARLESAEHQPTLETLVRLATATGLQFNLTITSEGAALRSA